jgi:hypothetical protein
MGENNDRPLEDQLQAMHEATLLLMRRALERSAHFPLNGYRRRIYFEGIALLARDLDLIASAASAIVRITGQDIQRL